MWSTTELPRGPANCRIDCRYAPTFGPWSGQPATEEIHFHGLDARPLVGDGAGMPADAPVAGMARVTPRSPGVATMPASKPVSPGGPSGEGGRLGESHGRPVFRYAKGPEAPAIDRRRMAVPQDRRHHTARRDGQGRQRLVAPLFWTRDREALPAWDHRKVATARSRRSMGGAWIDHSHTVEPGRYRNTARRCMR